MKKLELSKETLRCLTSDLPSEQLGAVRGGDASAGTCISCVECMTKVVTTLVRPTLIDNDCWQTR